MYRIIIHSQAKKKLLSLPSVTRTKIAEQIHTLGKDPNDERLDIKPMKGSPAFRLRVGDWRVIFSKNLQLKIIGIEKMGARGDVYK
jgi:mRNA interferase RelE/StbE